MVKKIVLLPALAASLALAACGGTATTSTQLSKDPAVRADQEQLIKQAKACYKGPKSLSKAGREKFITCFVPPERKEQTITCLQKETRKRGVPFTKKRSKVFLEETAHCVVTAK